MKAMKKALALGLALAMVVTAVPVTSAQAASTAKLSASKVSVAAGTAKKQTKSIKVTTPSTWKSVKVKASSSDKKIATVKVSGKTVKVTAVKKGSAKVTVKVSAKKSGKTVKKTLTAKVKVINAGLRFVDPATEVVVGESVSLAAKKSPKAAVVTYKSSDDTIATVDADGKVTAVKAGKVTITATSDYGKEVTTEVTVKDVVITDVKQTKANTLELTYKGDASKVTKDDFIVTRVADGIKFYSSSVSVDSTKKIITLATVSNLVDAKEYTVQYTADGSTLTFTASDGVVKSLTATPTTIPYGQATMINLNTVDKDGIILDTYKYQNGTNVGSKSEIEFSIETTQGYIDANNKLYLYEKGNTATVKATYHTYEYKDGSEVGKVDATITITADDQAIVDTANKFTYSNVKPYDWSKATLTDKVIMGEPAALQMLVKDSAGNSVIDGDPQTAGYAIESVNKDIAYTVGNVVYPNKVGTTTINVSLNGKIVWQLPVNVVEAAKLTSFTASKNSASVSNSTPAGATAKFVLEAKDQYGRPMAGNFVFTVLNAPSAAAKVAAAGTYVNGVSFAGASKATFEFYGTESNAKAVPTAKGTYSYKVELKNSTGATVYTQNITVNVLQPSGSAVTYRILMNDETTAYTGDNTVTIDSMDAQTLEIRVGKFVGGVLSEYVNVSSSSIKITKSNGTHVTTNASINGAGVATITSTPAEKVDFAVRTTSASVASTLGPQWNNTNTSDYTVTNGKWAYETAAADTYKVTAWVTDNGLLKSITQNFVIKNSQPQITVTKRANTNVVSAASTQEAIVAAFKFNYNGLTFTTDAPNTWSGLIDSTNVVSYQHINDKVLDNGDKLTFIQSVTITVPVVLGDLNSDSTIDANDVVYITQTVPCGYWLQWN